MNVVYAGSAGASREFIRWSLPEIAIAGRSNSGKSSLLNRLAGRRGLARVSGTPGRTQRLHFFAVEPMRLALVDLPGYGFARAARSARERWGALIEEYLDTRKNLRALLLLVDLRRDLGEDEEQLAEFVRERGLGFVPVATKVDKLGRAERERRLRAFGSGWIPFSARTGEGREEVLEALMRFSQ